MVLDELEAKDKKSKNKDDWNGGIRNKKKCTSSCELEEKAKKRTEQSQETTFC